MLWLPFSLLSWILLKQYIAKRDEVHLERSNTLDVFFKITKFLLGVRKVNGKKEDLCNNLNKPLSIGEFNDKHGSIYYIEPKPSPSECKIHEVSFDAVLEKCQYCMNCMKVRW